MTAGKAPAAVASLRGMERGATILWMECGACSGESMAILGAEGRGRPGHTLPAFLEDHGAQLLWHPSLSLESPREAARDHRPGDRGRAAADAVVRRGQHHPRAERHGGFDVFEGRPKRDIVAALCGRAQYVLAMGSCASFGGIPAAPPNPSESTGLQYTNNQPGGLLDPEWRSAAGLPVINLSACPVDATTMIETMSAVLEGRDLGLDRSGARRCRSRACRIPARSAAARWTRSATRATGASARSSRCPRRSSSIASRSRRAPEHSRRRRPRGDRATRHPDGAQPGRGRHGGQARAR